MARLFSKVPGTTEDGRIAAPGTSGESGRVSQPLHIGREITLQLELAQGVVDRLPVDLGEPHRLLRPELPLERIECGLQAGDVPVAELRVLAPTVVVVHPPD